MGWRRESMDGGKTGRRYALVAVPLLIPLLLFAFRDSFGDEYAVVGNALNFVAHRTVLPINVSYPTLYSYLATPLVVLGGVGAWLAGLGGSVRECVARSLAEDRWPLVIGPRLLSIVLVGAAGWTVTVTARRRFGDGAALVAAVALLSSHAVLVQGTYALPDPLVLFLCAASFGLLVRHAEDQDDRRLRWAAAAAGLASAAKYDAVCAVVPIAFVLGRRLSSAGSPGAFRELGRCAGAFTLAFVCGTPGWLIAPGLFAAGLRFEMNHAQVGHLGAAGVPVLGHLELLARYAPVALGLGAVGFGIGLRRRDRGTVLAWISFAGGLVMAATSHKQSIQYLFPILPALCYAAAAGVAYLATARVKVGLVAIGAALGICTGANLLAGLEAALHLSTTELARRWIEANVRSGSRVALENNYVPRLYSAEALAKLAAESPEGEPIARRLAGQPPQPLRGPRDPSQPALLLASGGPDVIVTSDQAYGRYFSSGLFTMRPPRADSPLWSQYSASREFYRELFTSPFWTEVLDMPAGNGPRTRVFARRTAQGVLLYAGPSRSPAPG